MVFGSAKSKVGERIGNWATLLSTCLSMCGMSCSRLAVLSWKLLQSWNLILWKISITMGHGASIYMEAGRRKNISEHGFTMGDKWERKMTE